MAELLLKHVYKIYPARNRRKKRGVSTARDSEFVAVKDFNMEINDGEFIVFVGPSGCGKSTTLRMIAGLENISSGEFYIDGELMNNVEPRDRDIAMVFQSYALYPHMTAYDNIAFGLRMRKIPEPALDESGNEVYAIDEKNVAALEKKISALEKQIEKNEIDIRKDRARRAAKLTKEKAKTTDEDKLKEYDERIAALTDAHTIDELIVKTSKYLEEQVASVSKQLERARTEEVPVLKYRHYTKEEIDERVKWAAHMLGIEELLNSKPSEMSGGQRQRIALGRAMVRGPKVFLLDEPLSNLDAKLRNIMRSEIVKLHNDLKTTFIYVTHDQVEAMTMGTRIVVMKDGIIQQIDTPTNLFDYPKNKFVAGFIGTPQMNFFNVTIKKVGKKLDITFADGQKISVDTANLRRMRKEYTDGEEHSAVLGVRGEHMSVSDKGIKVNVSLKEVLGSTTHLFFNLAGTESILCLAERVAYGQGDSIGIAFDSSKLHLFDVETEETLFVSEADK